MPRSRPLIERFHEKVDRRGPDECWPWVAACHDKGYGLIKDEGRRANLRAHRVAYVLQYGPVQGGLHVLHTCDNPPCCNPSHLFLGTDSGNKEDMMKKGRQSHPKLTEEKVAEIRRDYVRGSRTHGQPALARKYGVDHTTIGHIIRREQWTYE